MKLLSLNPKVEKGRGQGWLTYILHLAPASLSGYNVCPQATAGCIASCLNTAGRGGIIAKGNTTNAIQLARMSRTRFYFEDRKGFMAQLYKDISAAQRKADQLKLKLAIRLNGTSDIPWEKYSIFRDFPNVQFYDYTKVKKRMTSVLIPNYHLTYSRSENTSIDTIRDMIKAGKNVAVVFDKPYTAAEWEGMPVFSGDETDLRFLDPSGHIISLYAKGKAKRDMSGFVVRTT